MAVSKGLFSTPKELRAIYTENEHLLSPEEKKKASDGLIAFMGVWSDDNDVIVQDDNPLYEYLPRGASGGFTVIY